MKDSMYKGGFVFTKELGENLDLQYERVKVNNKASLIIIDGGVGEGKTTLALHCADYLNKLDGKGEVDIKSGDQVGLGGEDFLKKMRICHEKDLPVVIYDEAGDFGKRQALTKFNAMLNRTFETFRAFKIVVIIVLPSFSVLDNSIFDKAIPRMLIHCYGRNQTHGKFKVFSLNRMMYVRHYMKKEVIKPRAYSKQYPNVHGMFKNLSIARCKALDEVSTQGKLDELLSSEVKIQGLVGFADIGTRMGKSVRWAQEAIKELKIKPVRVIKSKKYFDESLVDILVDYTLTGKK